MSVRAMEAWLQSAVAATEVKRRPCLAQPVVEGYAALKEPHFGVFSD
jgi:hypothetical protein